ncbi:hypothetical protein MXM51_21460 [Pantoea stewartii]|uniref:hypothetical protein n=1 Tax=Pantoea stewartii TaxID=66269 RepID=UPI002DB976E7|nr:hypothetical protein [Pantoea stewartii]MEB6537084.1 hypothetical protein [Pantoea stewartii]
MLKSIKRMAVRLKTASVLHEPVYGCKRVTIGMDHLCSEVAHRFFEGYVQYFQTEAHRSTSRSEQSENTAHEVNKICVTGLGHER